MSAGDEPENMPTERASLKARAAASGVRVSRYALVRRCMQAYLSPILVDSILTKAMNAAGVGSRANADELLPKIVEHSVSGLKLFVAPERLSELMARLRVLAAPDSEPMASNAAAFPSKTRVG